MIMGDIFTPEKRSEVMSKIRSKWTTPERTVHNYLKGRKIRHKMHPAISGSPDITIDDSGIAVFVHGCFWHGCPKCYRKPKTNRKFWSTKMENNAKRHRRNVSRLQKDGWSVVTIWEHEIKKDILKCINNLL